MTGGVKVELTDRARKLSGRMAMKDLQHSARTLADTDAAASAALAPTPSPSAAASVAHQMLPPPTVLFATPKPTSRAGSDIECSPATPTSVVAPTSAVAAVPSAGTSVCVSPTTPTGLDTATDPVTCGAGGEGILVVARAASPTEPDSAVSSSVEHILALGSTHPEYKKLYAQFTRHAQSQYRCSNRASEVD